MATQGKANVAGCRESTIVICTALMAVLGVLAFFGIRQYTDLLGPAKSKEFQATETPTPTENTATQIESPVRSPPPTSALTLGWKSVTSDPTWVDDNMATMNVAMTVESAAILSDRTILRLACRLTSSSDSILFNASGSYIADPNGNTYDLSSDEGTYPFQYSNTSARTIRVDEIYRLNLVFPTINPDTPFVILHHSKFHAIRVYLK